MAASLTPISGLPIAIAFDGSEYLPLDQSNGDGTYTTKRGRLAQLTATLGLSGNVSTASTSRTLQNSIDKGGTIVLISGNYDTITLGATSGYDANFQVRLVNGEGPNVAAKWIAVPGLNIYGGFRLWPGQCCEIYNIGSQWAVNRLPRYKLPPGNFAVNTNYATGSDTESLADGLVRPFKSVEHGLGCCLNEFDFTATESNVSRVTVLMASGSNDAEQVHYSPHAQLGGYGGAAIVVDMNGGTLSGGVQLYFGAVMQFRNGTFAGEFDMSWGAKCYLLDGLTFGNPGAGFSHINLGSGAQLQMLNDYTISGSGGASGYHIAAANGAMLSTSNITASISTNLTFNTTVFASNAAQVDASHITWNLNAHTVTGTKFISQFGASIGGSAAIPGSSAGVALTGYAY